jgi:hypothetical protein
MVCGRCGSGMTVRYDAVNGKHSPRYLCQSHRRFAKSPCQSIPGAALDAAIGELVVEAVSPTALEASLDVQRELSARIEEADQLRHRQVERSQYEAQLARRRRFLRVDPDNRLVAAPSRPTTKALPARKSARGTASAGASNRSSTMNQPIRLKLAGRAEESRASEPARAEDSSSRHRGGREADVHGSVRSRLRGSKLTRAARPRRSRSQSEPQA